ncbi:MAG: protein phosphatase 2C domain-containing protein [Pyrinomonadaceae bacterium]
MSEVKQPYKIEASALTDRGLNERRPLNEDSFLADTERHIFAVADGVGGAEAGEVASQTAIEVIEEAFRHRVDGDIEDLMELAIQRANSSIHQMAQEHAKFNMMATTVVALHIEGNVATFGHVGDSRLYRLTPDGILMRETEDHSVVEEEVRAGRMTPEQAANHPSKNVISRALGAEDGVEVDMKTMAVDDGTEFLLCTDGITRHVPDGEIRQLMITGSDLDTVCSQLKQRCYERGAEDNLTAVIVRVGEKVTTDSRLAELEPTISPEMHQSYAPVAETPQTVVAAPQGAFVPASRIAFPGTDTPAAQSNYQPLRVDEPQTTGRSHTGAWLLAVLFVLILLTTAFYAGARYRDRVSFLARGNNSIAPVPSPVATPSDTFLQFERARREVDRAPQEWLANEVRQQLNREPVPTPVESSNPEFLYLYGRASLLTGNTDEAAKAFEAAISAADQIPSVSNDTIKKEATLGLAAVTLKTQKERDKALLHYDQLTKPPANANSP